MRRDNPNAAASFDDSWLDSLDALAKHWRDTPEFHQWVHESCIRRVNADPYLRPHRDWVEENHWGLGERSFGWLWRLVVDQTPAVFKFLEVGVHRGQITSLIGMLADRARKPATIVGVSPFDGTQMGLSGDFKADAEFAWKVWVRPNHLATMSLVTGSSADPKVQAELAAAGPYDVVYIDGDHTYDAVKVDLAFAAKNLADGGILAVDDSGCRYSMPWGYFAGIEEVSRATDELLPASGEGVALGCRWEWLANVMHLRVWRKWGG